MNHTPTRNGSRKRDSRASGDAARNGLWLLILLASAAFCTRARAQAPQFDIYGGLAALACPQAVTGSSNIQTAQIATTSSTAVTPGVTNQITLASTTRSDDKPLAVNESLDIDPGSTSPIAVTGETPAGSFAVTGSTNISGKWYGDGSTASFTGWIAHASVLESTVTVEVAGTVVANDVFGAIESGPAACPSCTNQLGNVTGHVSYDANDSRTWISIQFQSNVTPPNNAQITLSYSYLTTEVAQIKSINGNAVTFTNPLWNAHSAEFSVLDAYFRTAKSGNRWYLCDALDHPFYPISVEEEDLEQSSFGDASNAQMSVETTTTAAVAAGATTIPVASAAGIAPGPGMMLHIGPHTSSSEWVNVTAVTGLNLTTSSVQLAGGYTSGVAVECCEYAVTVTGSSQKYGAIPASQGKYKNSAWPVLNASPSQYQQVLIPRMKQWGFNGASPAGSNGVYAASVINNPAGFWDVPEKTPPFKVPYQLTTTECSNGLKNQYGYVSDLVLDGNQKVGHSQSGKIEDYFDANLWKWAAKNFGWFAENPWIVAIMPTQTDDCPGFGPGEHFQTLAVGAGTNGQGYNAIHNGWSTLTAPPYLSVNSVDMRNRNVTESNGSNPIGQRGTFISKVTALPQYLQGQLDPLNFPAAATGSNISLISCSGSYVQVTLAGAWLLAHYDPFTIGDLATVTATGFNTTSGQPAQVLAAVQGSHQVTLAYPGTSPCPGAPTHASGLIALGPGYQSLADLNGAAVGWATTGAGYTTWGSSGTRYTGQAVTCSATSCSFNVSGSIDPYSVQIVANCSVAAGCSGAGNFSGVVAADFVSTSGWTPPVTSGTQGLFNYSTPFSTALKATVTAGSSTSCAAGGSVAFTLNSYNGNQIWPGEILYFATDGTNPAEYVQVCSVQNKPGQLTTDSINSVTANFGYPHLLSSTAVSIAFPSVAATAFNYQTPASVSFTIAANLPAGWTLTANYNANGWANGGTGLLDEAGCYVAAGCTHTWTGSGTNSCVDNGTSAVCAGATFGNAAFERDLDGFSQAEAAYYARNYLEQERSALPHTLVIQSYRDGGARGAPGRQGTIHGQIPYLDIGWGSYVYNYAGAMPVSGAQYPCLSGGGWGRCNDAQLNARDTMLSWRGDGPQYDFWETSSDQDSALHCIVGAGTVGTSGTPCTSQSSQFDGFYNAVSQTDRAAQSARALNVEWLAPSVNGTYQFIGLDWWAPVDTPVGGGQFDDYGFITTQDNSYDGSEACTASSQPSVENIAGYPLIPVPETPPGKNCYGDFLHPWRGNLWSIYSALLGQIGTTTKLSNASVQGSAVH